MSKVNMLFDSMEMDKFLNRSREAWKKFIRIEGIKAVCPPSNLKKELAKERPRILNLLESGIITSPISISPVKSGANNFFIVNSPDDTPVCSKCNSHSYILLIMDKKYLDNLDKKVFLPGPSAYKHQDIDLDSPLFAKRFPIPVNPDTDYWYCPNCQRHHKFSFNKEKGLSFDQEPINI